MPFTAEELANITNSTIEYHVYGQPRSQILQDRPLTMALESAKKAITGAKDFTWTRPVSFAFTSTLHGYTGDDPLQFRNPTNVKRARYQLYEMHSGMTLTETELKQNGIQILGEKNDIKSTGNFTEAEKIQLVDLLEDKFYDQIEGTWRDFDLMMHLDGSQDPKEAPGLYAFVKPNPTTGIVGGLDQAQFTLWRNRTRTAAAGTGAINVSTEEIIAELTTEMRQLRRYRGKPTHAFCGSDWLDQMIKELRAKGNYTEMGWSKPQSTDIEVADVRYGNMKFVYDPQLDDLGTPKRCLILDLSKNGIRLRPMQGYDRKLVHPVRPYDKFVYHRSLVHTCGLEANQLNSSGVYDFV